MIYKSNLKWYSPLLPGALPEEKSHEVTMHRLGYPGKQASEIGSSSCLLKDAIK